MTAVPKPALHHMALTVSDVDASVAWYEAVFGVRYLVDVPHEGGVGKLLTDDEWTLMIVLHRHDANEGGLFSERQTGLDHVGLAVETRADLERWEEHLDANGVVRADPADKPLTRSAIMDEVYASVVVFRDPDNIQLELFAPAATRGPVPGQ